MRWMATVWLMMISVLGVKAAGTMVQFRTIKGDIMVELLDQEKPVTVANFLRYVQDVYPTNNVFIHRVVPDFIIQGGGFTVETRTSNEDFFSYAPIDKYGPITNEFNVGKKVSNTYGTIAMARLGGQTNSATSDWFINIADNSADLDTADGGFTVFGHVVGGTNVLQFFNSLRKEIPECTFKGIADMRCYYGNTTGGRRFMDLPVNYLGTRYPRYSDLFFVDITLYNVRVQIRPDQSREIRWNSVRSKTNVVEYTESFPSNWTTLKSFSADGSEQTVIDSDPQGSRRFYRVRVP
jgi:cyclophilin family peptidyl-prolyl cis-trans isomerase